MAIQTIQQLNNYAYALPWYKRIFFPPVIWARLQQLSVTETEIRESYAEVKASWLGLFYDWLFPELVLFAQMPSGEIPQQLQAAPIEENNLQLPANYEEDLRGSIYCKDHSEFNRLADFLSTHLIEEDVLIRILRTSIRSDNYFVTRTLSRKTVYNATVVSKAFVDAIKNTDDEWWGINAISAFTSKSSPLRSLINSVSMNDVMLLLASTYQSLASSQIERERLDFFHLQTDLQRLIDDKEIVNKITLATIIQFLQQVLIPLRYESEDSDALIRGAVNFEDAEGLKLHANDIQLAYQQTIRVGRVSALALFHEDILQPADERVIQALKDAAKNAHYTMVLHLIKKIPADRRFEILQTKAIVQNDKQYKDTQEPDFTHILQWAACRSVPEDIQSILDTLDPAQERYALTTNMSNREDYSPLLLAAVNCRQENLGIMLNALSIEQAIETILPKKITFFTPLDQFYSNPEEHEVKVMPMLLGKVFGENQKLYNAYQYLKIHMDRDTLRALCDHYLATHFPTDRPTAIRFFTGGYSIPGHPLNKEELDKVVRVVFYQNYHEFDSAQRSRIENRMNAREQPSGNVAII